VYEGTDVLRNLPGIRDGAELAAVEAELTARRIALLASNPIGGSYDLVHLQAFHRHLFDGLYEWAGQLRTVPIAKTDMFCLPQHIESYSDQVFAALARERQLKGLARKAFVERAAHFLGEVNAIHPFRDGNGRTQRAFFSHLAAGADHHLAWERVSRGRNSEAFVASHRGDDRPLEALIGAVTEPLERTRD
jgi:cell filamentation protein